MQFIGKIVMIMLMLRTSSVRQMAGPEGAHAWSWWCLLHRSTGRQNGSNGFSLQTDSEHVLSRGEFCPRGSVCQHSRGRPFFPSGMLSGALRADSNW